MYVDEFMVFDSKIGRAYVKYLSISKMMIAFLIVHFLCNLQVFVDTYRGENCFGHKGCHLSIWNRLDKITYDKLYEKLEGNEEIKIFISEWCNQYSESDEDNCYSDATELDPACEILDELSMNIYDQVKCMKFPN